VRRKPAQVIADLIPYPPERREPLLFIALDGRRVVEAVMQAIRMSGTDRTGLARVAGGPRAGAFPFEVVACVVTRWRNKPSAIWL